MRKKNDMHALHVDPVVHFTSFFSESCFSIVKEFLNLLRCNVSLANLSFFSFFLRQLIEIVTFEFRLERISWLCKVISTSFSMIFAVVWSICLSRLYDRMKFRESKVFLSVLLL